MVQSLYIQRYSVGIVDRGSFDILLSTFECSGPSSSLRFRSAQAQLVVGADGTKAFLDRECDTTMQVVGSL